MSPLERILYERIRRRAAYLQPDLARRLLAAYDVIRSGLTDAELIDAIRSGMADQLINELLSDDVLDPAFGPLRALVDQTVLDAAKQAAGELPRGAQSPAFNVLNPTIIEMARTLDTRVIRALKAEVRDTVRQAVIAGIGSGQNPRAVARTIRATVGLSPGQEIWVANFRREIATGDRAALNRVLGRGVIRTPSGTEIVRESHAGGIGVAKRDLETLNGKLGKAPLSADQIDRITDSYRRRLNALNAETQTRTMALDAQRAGQRASWEDAISQGIVDRTKLRRVWVSTHDDRVRPEHAALDGTEVGWDQPYPNGEILPGESTYNCRCIERVFQAREAMVA